MVDLSVIILTKNESMHLPRALASVRSIASKVFVIDSGSTDDTVSIAENFGATVLVNEFVNHALQFQWALDNAPIRTNWVMRLDADEYLEDDLRGEIAERLPKLSAEVVGVNLDRKHIFMGRWVRFGGRYPLRLLRIWRHGKGRIESRWMDEHMLVWGGRVVSFKGGFVDENLNDLTFFTEKHNKYATREAIDVINQRLKLFPRDLDMSSENTSWQASLKRLMKEGVYNRLPFAFACLLYFIWRYVFQLGFLDGRSGLIYHFLQGFWYRFLVGAKVMELEAAISGLEDKREIVAALSKITGLKLAESR